MIFLILILTAIVIGYANRVKLRAWVQSHLPQELAPPTVLPPAPPPVTLQEMAAQIEVKKAQEPDPPKAA